MLEDRIRTLEIADDTELCILDAALSDYAQRHAPAVSTSPHQAALDNLRRRLAVLEAT